MLATTLDLCAQAHNILSLTATFFDQPAFEVSSDRAFGPFLIYTAEGLASSKSFQEELHDVASVH